MLEAVVDKAIIAAARTAIGSALIETGVGPVVGYGLAAIQIAQIVELLGRAGTKIQTAGVVIEGFTGAIMGLAYQGGSLKQYPLPAAAYDHPAVA